jgi:hypothetical protein
MKEDIIKKSKKQKVAECLAKLFYVLMAVYAILLTFLSGYFAYNNPDT